MRKYDKRFDEIFTREPSPRTPEEAEYEQLAKEYEEMFGEQFGYAICCAPTTKEAIAEVKECLRTKTKQKKSGWILPEGALI